MIPVLISRDIELQLCIIQVFLQLLLSTLNCVKVDDRGVVSSHVIQTVLVHSDCCATERELAPFTNVFFLHAPSLYADCQ